MKRKYLQLVLHKNNNWEWYAIHEALMEDGQTTPYWVGSKPIRKFDNYHDAVANWARTEPKSAFVDILNFVDIHELIDRVDYSKIEELDFND